MNNYPDGSMRAWDPQSPEHEDKLEWIGEADMDLLRATLEAAEDASMSPRLTHAARLEAAEIAAEIAKEIAWRESECANPCSEDLL